MFTIVIEDLKMHLNNSNLPIENNIICFKLLAQKKDIDKQTASILYYKY